ncbi:MAG TPA: ABC transporter substrate-binding protein [Candidatus Acidoferrum sp.]|nr:ABC transporter substrate-binding protein [Candidatus Acidoferrum sp.]
MGRVAAALVFVLVALSRAWGETTPTESLQEVFAKANGVLTDPDSEDRPLDRLLAIRKLVNDAFDFKGAAELASGDHWLARTAAEQEEFTWLFSDLLERAFLSRMAAKASLDGGTKIRYLDETIEGATALVQTAMARRNGGELLLDYRLVDREGAWKIRDVAIDGVSLMANYRAQLDRVLGNASFPELLSQMRAKVGVADQPEAPAPVSPAPAPVATIDVPARADTATETTEAADSTTAADSTAATETTAAAEATAATEETKVATEATTAAESTAATEPTEEPKAATQVTVAAATTAAAEPTADTKEIAPPIQMVSIVDVPLPALEIRLASLAPTITLPKIMRPAAFAIGPASPPSEEKMTPPSTPPPAVATPPVAKSLAAATQPAVKPPASRTVTTRAYWLRMMTAGTADEANRLVNRLRDAKFPVAVARTHGGGKLRVSVRVGPFRDAEQAVLNLLDLQTKGHNPHLVAERD